MSAYESASESDNDAPEELTLSSTRKSTKATSKQEKALESKLAQTKKAKARASDVKLKVAAKGKAKAKAAEIVEEEIEEEDEDEDEDESMEGELSFEEHDDVIQSDEEEEEEDDEDIPATASSSKHLDPSIFASAAASFSKEAAANAPVPAGMGKHKMKRMVRAQKAARAAIAAQKAGQVGEGGAREVGGRTVQHLSTISASTPNLSSETIRPSHSSAAKFLTNRLYSKKRVLSVLDAGKPKEDGSERKRPKGGMSDESRILLGMPVANAGKVKAGSSKSDKKRSLLLQAEGRRTPAAQRLSSSRSGSKPAQDFAQSTRGQ